MEMYGIHAISTQTTIITARAFLFGVLMDNVIFSIRLKILGQDKS